MILPTLYLIRHATPDWSRTDIPYHLPPGPRLTAHGEQEAAQLGEFLRAMGVRDLWTSPLERCQQTALIAAGVAGLTRAPGEPAGLRPEPRLAEWQPHEKAPDVLARVWPVWAEAGEVCLAAGPVALVTHGGPISVLLAELGVDPRQIGHYQRIFDRNNPVPPAGAWRAIRPSPDGPWSLDLAYTPEEHRARAWLV
jgi:broad specificity phosphatase PhoE